MFSKIFNSLKSSYFKTILHQSNKVQKLFMFTESEIRLNYDVNLIINKRTLIL